MLTNNGFNKNKDVALLFEIYTADDVAVILDKMNMLLMISEDARAEINDTLGERYHYLLPLLKKLVAVVEPPRFPLQSLN